MHKLNTMVYTLVHKDAHEEHEVTFTVDKRVQVEGSTPMRVLTISNGVSISREHARVLWNALIREDGMVPK